MATIKRMDHSKDGVDEYSSPTNPQGNTFQDPQWVPKMAHSTEHYIYHVFLYTHITLWFLLGTSELPAPLLLHFGAITK